MSDDFFDDHFGWEETGAFFAIAEEMSEEKERLRQLEIEEESSCCTKDDEEQDPSGEEFIP